MLSLIAMQSWCQYTVTGKITNSTNSQPIALATIQVNLNNGKFITYTISNTHGEYTLELKNTGNYTIKITHIEYESVIDTIEINNTPNILDKNFILTEKTETLGEVFLEYTPKVMKIQQDTITYNLKKLTNGTEKNLSNILEKLPGVEITPGGQIVVNGKMVQKLLIDGEELFKKQHRTTSESITSKMIEGIRYLDKYNDFGNLEGFDNNLIRALDVTIKDEYKNRITGDVRVEGGIASKASTHSNLYRLGGKLKLGFIGDWNNLGKQSLTSYEYSRLVQTRESDDLHINNLPTQPQNEQIPKFFDPTLDVSQRENTFGALSFVYKPYKKLKISFLNVTSNTNQSQRFLLTRNFFENPNAQQQESRVIESTFFLNTTLLELGYQPNKKSFVNYIISYNPQNSDDEYFVDNRSRQRSNSFLQNITNKGHTINQKLSITQKIRPKTILTWSGVVETQNSKNNVDIQSNEPFLNLNLENTFDVFQFQNQESRVYGYELQTSTKYENSKLEFHQGIFFSKDTFTNTLENNDTFANNIETDHTDSYFGMQYKGNVSSKFYYSAKTQYRYVSFNRFDQTFDRYFFLPSFTIDYRLNVSQNLGFEYAYDYQIPGSKALNRNTIVKDYFRQQLSSTIDNDEILPSHSIRANYFYIHSKSGSNFLLFGNYNFAPRFLTMNTFLENSVINFQNIIGKNRNRVTLGSRIKYAINKLNLSIFANPTWSFIEEENQINSQHNISKTSRLSLLSGIYTNFRKGINFTTGLSYDVLNYNTTVNNIETKSSSLKPYFYVNGSLFSQKLTWKLGGEYAIYETDIDRTEILDIRPGLQFSANDHWEITLEGNNILNINNAEITENFNAINYTESRISDTIEGFLVLGVRYLVK
ncbi:carboxypeptidase-like regulatory domain-containing protein [Aquimarina sp. U1-2]|uniref:carboxypeptidase-like regulatory domain-containing protein n=1 Tax=Aquimarina sp. U1-2 TaxID=2823141 RepID=UPI001AEC9E1F|nr:carboxypeptidase-like regulatory domain-containing protein [Aquimarina sp. U1-2]MBP2832797.1 carboxypeptidase-like regulatory domain-containing protein [Aquimarina sp. U1-2]